MTLTVEALRLAREANYNAAQALKRERYPEKGDKVVVVRGRKIPKGTEATLDGWGENDFGHYVRLIMADGQTVFTARHNVSFVRCDAEHEAAVAEAKTAARAYHAMLSEAVTLAGVDLSKPLEGTGKLQQLSYSDLYEADYACNPECPDDILSYVVGALDPATSSWGKLRWSTGSSVVSRNGGIVRVLSGTGLCD